MVCHIQPLYVAISGFVGTHCGFSRSGLMGDKATRRINISLRITVPHTPSFQPLGEANAERHPSGSLQAARAGTGSPRRRACHALRCSLPPRRAAGQGSAPTSRFRCPFWTMRMSPRSGQPRRSGQHPLPFGVRAEGPPVTALHAPVGSRPPRTVQLGGCDVQDRDGVGMRPPMPGTRRRRSSHRPTALRQAMSDRPGTSGLAARPSNTARGRQAAAWSGPASTSTQRQPA
jgi:hypothetical protein